MSLAVRDCLLPESNAEAAVRTALRENPDGVLEAVNIHGDSPLGGHLKIERCAAIYFVDRPFFKRRSCSIQFINGEGQAMFKIFVGRDENKTLRPEQIARFEALRAETASRKED